MLKKMILTGIIFVLTLGFVSSVFAEVGVHGFILARTILTNNNYTSRIERFGIKKKKKIDDEFDWVTEIYIHPQRRGRNYCYGQTPAYSRRRTTDYPLYSEAFTQLRVVGFQTFSNFGENIQLAVAIINPYTNRGRFLPDFPVGDSIQLPFSDRDTESSEFDRVALSGRLGYKNNLINVGGNLYISDPKEGVVGAKTRFGVDGEIKLESGILAQVQATMAQTQDVADDLDHMGTEVLVGWEPDKLGLYARYGMLTYDDKYQALNSIMLSAVYKIRPRIHLRLEGLINGEDTDDAKGWAEVDNNVLFFETLFAW